MRSNSLCDMCFCMNLKVYITYVLCFKICADVDFKICVGVYVTKFASVPLLLGAGEEETWRRPRHRAWGRSGVRVAVCRWEGQGEATNNQRTAVRDCFGHAT
jgi:hypothetical protein